MIQPFRTSRYPSAWWQLYVAAIQELDSQRLPVRIQSAIGAINMRRAALEERQDVEQERIALIEARNALAVLDILRKAEQDQLPLKIAV